MAVESGKSFAATDAALNNDGELNNKAALLSDVAVEGAGMDPEYCGLTKGLRAIEGTCGFKDVSVSEGAWLGVGVGLSQTCAVCVCE